MKTFTLIIAILAYSFAAISQNRTTTLSKKNIKKSIWTKTISHENPTTKNYSYQNGKYYPLGTYYEYQVTMSSRYKNTWNSEISFSITTKTGMLETISFYEKILSHPTLDKNEKVEFYDAPYVTAIELHKRRIIIFDKWNKANKDRNTIAKFVEDMRKNLHYFEIELGLDKI